MGTVLLACEESGRLRLIARLCDDAMPDLLLGQRVHGKPHGNHNRVMEDLNRDGTEMLPYPLQRELVRISQSQQRLPGRADLCLCGLAKRQSFDLHRMYRLLDLIGRGKFEIAGPIISGASPREKTNSK